MDRMELKQRLIDFAARVFTLHSELKRRGAASYAEQLVRSSSSIGANYHEAVHGRSGAEFVAKIKIAEGEAAETHYWLSLVARAGIIPQNRLHSLIDEAAQLTAILHATSNSYYRNHGKNRD